jgi:hypothetical protein
VNLRQTWQRIDDARFFGRHDIETFHHPVARVIVASGTLAREGPNGEIDEEHRVLGLGLKEFAIKRAQCFVVEVLRKKSKTLAGARLDERADEQAIDHVFDWRCSHQSEQPFGIGVCARVADAFAPCVHDRDDAHQMGRFFGGEGRELFDEHRVVRIA